MLQRADLIARLSANPTENERQFVKTLIIIETLVDIIGVTFGEFGKGYTGVQAVLELLELIIC